MKLLLILIFGLFLNKLAQSQLNNSPTNNKEIAKQISDTIRSSGENYELIHFHVVSRDISALVSADTENKIFNEGWNNFSRLIFTSREHSFDVPTVPLNHVIFLEKPGLIIGLSKITFSPYNIIIYSIDGKLIYKAALKSFELKLNKGQLKNLLATHPDLKECLSQQAIVKNKDWYFLELSRCLVNIIGRDSLVNKGLLVANHYFPMMTETSEAWDTHYKQFRHSFSNSDPFYDLLLIGSEPYLLILNSEDGTKVPIPLRSNCDIINEIYQEQKK